MSERRDRRGHTYISEETFKLFIAAIHKYFFTKQGRWGLQNFYIPIYKIGLCSKLDNKGLELNIIGQFPIYVPLP